MEHSLYKYKILSLQKIADDIVEITIHPVDTHLKCLPGQFVFVSFLCKDLPEEWHPFGISCNPSKENLTLTIKTLGDYTKKLPELEAGTELLIKGPYGNFLSETKNSQIWIAGGVGLVPFLSDLDKVRTEVQGVDLYYVVHSLDEAVHVVDLLKIASQNPHFRVCIYETATKGHLTAEKIQEMSGDLKNKDFFICGPPPMEKAIHEQLLASNVPPSQIHAEAFSEIKDPKDLP
jgi:predicted ferric reductase